MNKSIEGTADDEEEGVSPDTAIRSGLELLKVFLKEFFFSAVIIWIPLRICKSGFISLETIQKIKICNRNHIL